VTVRTFPNNLTAKMFGYEPKPNFTVENEKSISSAPRVDFGSPPPTGPASSPAR
ncbi:MAG: LemA family protein, partial [Actinomycetota bacterium]